MPQQPDYFALYGIPPGLTPDPSILRKRYYELSRQHHPDRLSGQEPAAQQETLKVSAQVNEGYRILNDPDALLGYVLKKLNLLEEEEQYKLPPEFLMEMMELNELVEDASEPSPQAQQELEAQFNVWKAGFEPLKNRFNNGERDDQLLGGLKDYYFRKKYLLRIKERFH